MSPFFVALFVGIIIDDIKSEIIWFDTDFHDISEWASDGALESSNDNECPNKSYNTCGKLNPSNNGYYMERYANCVDYYNISISFVAVIDGTLDRNEMFFIQYNCTGNWAILTLFTDTTAIDVYFDDRYMLPQHCNRNPNVGIRFGFIASSEDMYFNDVYLRGELYQSTQFPTIYPSIQPTRNDTNELVSFNVSNSPVLLTANSSVIHVIINEVKPFELATYLKWIIVGICGFICVITCAITTVCYCIFMKLTKKKITLSISVSPNNIIDVNDLNKNDEFNDNDNDSDSPIPKDIDDHNAIIGNNENEKNGEISITMDSH